MRNQQRRDAMVGALRFVPVKWAIAIVVALIAYVLLQPRVNQWFGWHLPSITSMLGEEDPKPKQDKSKKTTKPAGSSKTHSKDSNSKEPSSKNTAGNESDSHTEKDTDTSSADHSSRKRDSKPKNNSPNSLDSETNDVGTVEALADETTSPSRASSENSDKEYGVLTSIGRNRFKSPAGLLYGPGSEEGHRLKHIERHLSDQPDRPGTHGVFDGEMSEFLIAIDDAYTRAKRKDKGTKRIDEEDSIVYEASFPKPIGYQGGQEGARRKHPKLSHLRVVVRGESVITAFPF